MIAVMREGFGMWLCRGFVGRSGRFYCIWVCFFFFFLGFYRGLLNFYSDLKSQ